MKTDNQIKDADTLINDFTDSCDAGKALEIFARLTLANGHLRGLGVNIHPDAPWSVNPKDEEIQKTLRAISTLLYEIEQTLKPVKS